MGGCGSLARGRSRGCLPTGLYIDNSLFLLLLPPTSIFPVLFITQFKDSSRTSYPYIFHTDLISHVSCVFRQQCVQTLRPTALRKD